MAFMSSFRNFREMKGCYPKFVHMFPEQLTDLV
jgi:hypothetical protein